MTPTEVLDLVIARFETQEAFAQQIARLTRRPCSPQAVSKWRRKGYVPSDRVPAVIQLADGHPDVTAKALCPSAFDLPSGDDAEPQTAAR